MADLYEEERRTCGTDAITPRHTGRILTSLTPPGTAVTQSGPPEPLVGTQGPMLTVWAAGGAGHRAEQGQGRSRCRRLVPAAPCSRPAAGRHLPAAFPAAPRRAGPPEQILLLVTKIKTQLLPLQKKHAPNTLYVKVMLLPKPPSS